MESKNKYLIKKNSKSLIEDVFTENSGFYEFVNT